MGREEWTRWTGEVRGEAGTHRSGGGAEEGRSRRKGEKRGEREILLPVEVMQVGPDRDSMTSCHLWIFTSFYQK